MVPDSDAWVGRMATETRGLKFRNGVGKRGKKNRKDQLGFRKGTGER